MNTPAELLHSEAGVEALVRAANPAYEAAQPATQSLWRSQARQYLRAIVAIEETPHPLHSQLSSIFTDDVRFEIAAIIRDWIHTQPWSLCGPGADTCPDWEAAFEIRDMVLEALDRALRMNGVTYDDIRHRTSHTILGDSGRAGSKQADNRLHLPHARLPKFLRRTRLRGTDQSGDREKADRT